jgi:riboflavin kinase/FMN adenylyltransferase
MLYGVLVAVEFTVRIRGQVKFDSIEALVTQMRADVDEIRTLLLG